MILVKFGGSVITNKGKECAFRSKTTKRLIKELCNYYDELTYRSEHESENTPRSNNQNGFKLILVHGAGSFGHILAKKFELHQGYNAKKEGQIIGLSKVHRDVRDLDLRIMNMLLSFRMPVISIPPMTVLRNKNNNFKFMDPDIFEKALDMHCLPMTFGDVVPDEKLKFSICSGDTLIQQLTKVFKPSRVIFVTDVDGLFTSNPHLKETDAKLISNLTEGSFNSAITNQNINPDVTGGIYQKSKIAIELAKQGIVSYIINGNVPGRFGSALRGHDVVGTVAK